jgi:hypothetical protein
MTPLNTAAAAPNLKHHAHKLQHSHHNTCQTHQLSTVTTLYNAAECQPDLQAACGYLYTSQAVLQPYWKRCNHRNATILQLNNIVELQPY